MVFISPIAPITDLCHCCIFKVLSDTLNNKGIIQEKSGLRYTVNRQFQFQLYYGHWAFLLCKTESIVQRSHRSNLSTLCLTKLLLLSKVQQPRRVSQEIHSHISTFTSLNSQCDLSSHFRLLLHPILSSARYETSF